MRDSIKRATCIALSSAVVFSMTGCSNLPFGGAKTEDIIDAGEAFAKAAASCDLGKMGKVSGDKFKKDTEDWEVLLDFTEGDVYDANAAQFTAAVADTIAYEIDEESAEASKDEASLDVVFTIADYAPIIEDEEITDIDTMIAALGDADTNEIEQTIEFEKNDDGDWVVTNYEDIMNDLYKFTDTTAIEFPVDYAECVQDIWWNGDELTSESSDHLTANFTNCTDFNCTVTLDSDRCDSSLVSSTVEYNGQVVNSENTNIGMYATWYSNAELDDTEQYLAAGTYTITFYDPDGNPFLTVSAVVTVDVTPTPTPTPAASTPDASAEYEFEPLVGMANSTPDNEPEIYMAFGGTPYWADSDNGVYESGTTSVSLVQPGVSEDVGTLYYTVIYSETSVCTAQDAELCTMFAMATAQTADDGSIYYEFSFDTMGDGYYMIVITASLADMDDAVMAGVCRVGAPN